MDITKSKSSDVKFMTEPMAPAILPRILLIPPIKLPKTFPTMPVRIFSTKHSGALTTLLIIVSNIFFTIFSSPLMTRMKRQEIAESAWSVISFPIYLADRGILPIISFIKDSSFLRVHFLTC